MSGNSGSALDASGMWEHKILILNHISVLQNNKIKYVQTKYKASSLLSSPRNCWYCWTCVLMSTCPDPCCCCWPAPTAVPLVIPSTLCTGFNLRRMQKEVIVVKLTVTFDPSPDQAPGTFFHPWTTTHWCGSNVTRMQRRFEYSGFKAGKNPKPVATLWLGSHYQDKQTYIWFIQLTSLMSNFLSELRDQRNYIGF